MYVVKINCNKMSLTVNFSDFFNEIFLSRDIFLKLANRFILSHVLYNLIISSNIHYILH